MAIHLLNYRHGHLHTSWSTIRGAGNEFWSGEAISRLKPGQQMEPSGKQDFLQQGGNKQAGRNTPGLADSATGHRMGWAASSFPSVFHSSLPPFSKPWPSGPAEDGGSPDQDRMNLSSSATVRISLLEGRGTGRHGALSGSWRLSLAHKHRLVSVLKINSLTWIYFYISGRLGSRSASQNKARLFNGI